MVNMLPPRLRWFLIIGILFFFIIVLNLLKHRRLSLKQTLLWLLTGVVMLVFAIRPEIMLFLIRLVGIQSAMNGLYVFALAFVIMLLMSITAITSAQAERIKRLAQMQAITDHDLREAREAVGMRNIYKEVELKKEREAAKSRNTGKGASRNEAPEGTGRRNTAGDTVQVKARKAGTAFENTSSADGAETDTP